MNYTTEERKNALAAAYVVGTLQGSARRRFTRLLMEKDVLRTTLWRWESRLNTLGGALPPQAPSPQVWVTIQQRLGFVTDEVVVAPSANTTNVVAFPDKARPWRWLAGLSAAAALVLAVVLVNFPDPQPLEDGRVAVVQSEKAEALWLIKLKASVLEVTAGSKLQPQANQDYELWMIVADGRPPVSLGLLPKQGKVNLPRPDLFDQVQVAALAVSLEPLGGSPNGKPTTVLYTAELMTL